MKLHKFKKINVTYLLIAICLTVFFIELFYNYFIGTGALENLFYTFGFSLDIHARKSRTFGIKYDSIIFLWFSY